MLEKESREFKSVKLSLAIDQIYLIHRGNPSKKEPGSNSNEKLLHTAHIPRNEASPPDVVQCNKQDTIFLAWGLHLFSVSISVFCSVLLGYKWQEKKDEEEMCSKEMKI